MRKEACSHVSLVPWIHLITEDILLNQYENWLIAAKLLLLLPHHCLITHTEYKAVISHAKATVLQ